MLDTARQHRHTSPVSIDDLRALVLVMRELGVVEFEGVTLGPVPPPPPSPEEHDTAEDASAAAHVAAEAHRRGLFYKAAR